jgi:hypothetical protein
MQVLHCLGQEANEGGEVKSDFSIQYNDNGDWHDALVSTAKDANNVSLWWIGDAGGWHFVADASRGDGNGQFRDRK